MSNLGNTPQQAGGGSALIPQYGTRHVKQYLVSDSELENLSFINGLANWAFGVGAFFLSWPVGIWIDSQMGAPAARAELLMRWVAIPVLVLSLACFGLGIYALWSRRSAIRIIKQETQH